MGKIVIDIFLSLLKEKIKSFQTRKTELKNQEARFICLYNCAFDFFLQLYLTDAGLPGSVLEMINGLGDPYEEGQENL
jgi:hypothetical protein